MICNGRKVMTLLWEEEGSVFYLHKVDKDKELNPGHYPHQLEAG